MFDVVFLVRFCSILVKRCDEPVSVPLALVGQLDLSVNPLLTVTDTVGTDFPHSFSISNAVLNSLSVKKSQAFILKVHLYIFI